jgi:hypothetical protein
MSQQSQRRPPISPHADEPAPESLRRNAFWAPRTIEQLAAEQGVSLPQDVDALLGRGAELWDSDDDLERFLAGIAERRRGDGVSSP